VKTPEELRESGLERTAFLIDRVTWRAGMACPDHQVWYEKKRESWATLGLGVVKELLAAIAELKAERDEYLTTCTQLDAERNKERARAEQAEAALAERDGRRCIDCALLTYMDCPVWPAFHRGETVEALPPDYCCSLWTARAEEGSTDGS
jgi:hypothetical protein